MFCKGSRNVLQRKVGIRSALGEATQAGAKYEVVLVLHSQFDPAYPFFIAEQCCDARDVRPEEEFLDIRCIPSTQVFAYQCKKRTVLQELVSVVAGTQIHYAKDFIVLLEVCEEHDGRITRQRL